MLSAPGNWQKYYSGSEHEQWIQRHFSLSDRIRYYWPQASVVMAVEELTRQLGEREIPAPVLHQYFPELGIRNEPATAHDLLLGSVRQVLELYEKAT